MSVLAPFFLLGLGLLVLPFWLHRLQTDNPERESFASTMFLAASQKRVHVRKKLRHILLMLLRLLLLLLLVLAFSQPVLESSEQLLITDNQRMHIIVVDTSASMMNENIFEQAIVQAKSIVNNSDGVDLIRLYHFGPSLVALEEDSANRDQYMTALEQLQPEPVAADVGILMAELSRLDWNKPFDYQLHIISDLQQSALPDRYADMIPNLPKSAQVTFNFYPVIRSDSANWFVESVHEQTHGLNVTVRGFNTPQQEIALKIFVGDEEQNESNILVPASGSASIFIPALDYEPLLNQVKVELLVNDELSADNDYAMVVDKSPAEPVLLLTSNPYAPAATYLSAAMSSIGKGGSIQRQGAGYRVEVVTLAEFDPRTLQRYSWLLIDDIGIVTPNLNDALNNYIESGGALFAAAGPAAASLQSLPVTDHQIISNAFSLEKRFYNVAQVDNSHPVLNNITDWSDLNFSEAVAINVIPEDDVLVSLDNGAPLLIEQKRGQGKVILLTSSIDNLWNNLPVKPLYISLMTEIASYLSNSESVRSQWLGGETFSLKEMKSDSGQLIDPQGRAVLALGKNQFSNTHLFNQTGFYQTYTATTEGVIAVNVAAIESNLTALSAQDVERWQQALRGEAINENKQITESDSVYEVLPQTLKQPLWFGLMCAFALLLIIESLFANMQLRQRGYF
jgi:hypothetical protein